MRIKWTIDGIGPSGQMEHVEREESADGVMCVWAQASGEWVRIDGTFAGEIGSQRAAGMLGALAGDYALRRGWGRWQRIGFGLRILRHMARFANRAEEGEAG